jgi:hypothetical protein
MPNRLTEQPTRLCTIAAYDTGHFSALGWEAQEGASWNRCHHRKLPGTVATIPGHHVGLDALPVAQMTATQRSL